MKFAFILLTLVHALIHLLGFVKAFQLAELKDFPIQVSKPAGLFWLGAAMMLLTVAIFYYLENKDWWIFAFIGLLISQALIISQWSEAKFGSFPNLIILLVAVIAFFQYNFEKKVQKETKAHIQNMEEVPTLTAASIQHLPAPVQKWLNRSGLVGNPPLKSVYSEQSYRLKLKPEQKNWYAASAQQLSTVNPPSFIWSVDVQMMPLLFATGRDRFYHGEGEMLIKLLALFPVANEGKNNQINEATLQRFLGEIVWYPSAAIMDYIQWKELDSHSAEATMQIGNSSGSGIFEFDDEGKLIRFSTQRYMGSGADAVKKDWIVEVLEHQAFDGILLPSRCSATWRLETGDWTWAEIQIDSVNFNRD